MLFRSPNPKPQTPNPKPQTPNPRVTDNLEFMLSSPNKKPSSSRRSHAPINWQPKVQASVDFLAFCNSLDYTQTAIKDNIRLPDEKRLYGKDSRKVFNDNLNMLVDNFRNTEDTLDVDKKKMKEIVDDDDMSRVGGDDVSKMDGFSVGPTEMKKIARSGELSVLQDTDAIYEGSFLVNRWTYILGVGKRCNEVLREKEKTQREGKKFIT